MILLAENFVDHLKYLHLSIHDVYCLASCPLVSMLTTMAATYFQMPPLSPSPSPMEPLWAQ